MMTDCKKSLDQGNPVLIFPEGTRSPDGRIRRFKTGAFILAIEHRTPVLPIVVSGTNKALPKYSFNFHGSHDIRVRVMPEIPYDEFADLSPEDAAEMVRDMMIRELENLESEQR